MDAGVANTHWRYMNGFINERDRLEPPTGQRAELQSAFSAAFLEIIPPHEKYPWPLQKVMRVQNQQKQALKISHAQKSATVSSVQPCARLFSH